MMYLHPFPMQAVAALLFSMGISIVWVSLGRKTCLNGNIYTLGKFGQENLPEWKYSLSGKVWQDSLLPDAFFIKFSHNFSTRYLTWLTKRGIVIPDIEQQRK